MATLAALRAKLNGEIGVDVDADTIPWTIAVRNAAIIDGYAELWRIGVWKPVVQTIATVDDAWSYVTTLRAIQRIELKDSGAIIDVPVARIEADGSGAYLMTMGFPLVGGFSMNVRGYTAYKSQLTSDADTDDLPAEDNRVPLLKAKAILFRAQSARFMRYGENQAVDPTMRSTFDQMLAAVAAAEREFEVEAKRLRGQRPRTMVAASVGL